MALYRSAWHAAEFENIGRNVVIASKSGPVETEPTVLVATALVCDIRVCTLCVLSICSGIGTTGAPGAGAPVNIIISSIYHV